MAERLPEFVTTGLDPVVQAEVIKRSGTAYAELVRRMDARVKPGHDEGMETMPN